MLNCMLVRICYVLNVIYSFILINVCILTAAGPIIDVMSTLFGCYSSLFLQRS